MLGGKRARLAGSPKFEPWHCIDQSRWYIFITKDLGRCVRESRGSRSLRLHNESSLNKKMKCFDKLLILCMTERINFSSPAHLSFSCI